MANLSISRLDESFLAEESTVSSLPDGPSFSLEANSGEFDQSLFFLIPTTGRREGFLPSRRDEGDGERNWQSRCELNPLGCNRPTNDAAT
mmetsp:Transcript_37644/g.80367  ORF Transcript_37644/g.80367 Transcript_37644/m.80367 type:complete len:90 (+) Transcript_37644:1443-1712(+)